jgi:hypothetical protein
MLGVVHFGLQRPSSCILPLPSTFERRCQHFISGTTILATHYGGSPVFIVVQHSHIHQMTPRLLITSLSPASQPLMHTLKTFQAYMVCSRQIKDGGESYTSLLFRLPFLYFLSHSRFALCLHGSGRIGICA